MGSFWKLVGFANTYSTGFFAYLAVGCLSVATEWGTFAIAATVVPPIEAALLGFVTATGVNFVLSRTYVFRSRSSWSSELVLVALASAGVFVWNLAVFYVLYDRLGVHMMIAKMAGSGVGFLLNFVARQFLIFSPKPRFAPVSARLATPADKRSIAVQGSTDFGVTRWPRTARSPRVCYRHPSSIVERSGSNRTSTPRGV